MIWLTPAHVWLSEIGHWLHLTARAMESDLNYTKEKEKTDYCRKRFYRMFWHGIAWAVIHFSHITSGWESGTNNFNLVHRANWKTAHHPKILNFETGAMTGWNLRLVLFGSKYGLCAGSRVWTDIWDYKNRLWQKLIILYQMSISPSSEHSWNTFLSLSHS